MSEGAEVIREQMEAAIATPEQEPFEILQSPLRMSKEIGEIAPAFCQAQAEFQAAAKAAENPAYMRGGKASRYADLSSVIEAALPALNKYGIGVLQPAYLSNGNAVVMTRLQHKSGQYFESELTMPSPGRQGFTAQTVGSAITYARRYSLQALICLAAEDDDGNAASGVGSKAAQEEVVKKKVAAHAAGEVTPSLFYVWFKESQTGRITGPKELLAANEDLLKPFVTSVLDDDTKKQVKAIVVNDEQLENLKFELNNRGVQFTHLKAADAK